MKRRASDVLSVGGGQINEVGVDIRKRVALPAGEEKEAELTAEDTTNQSSSSSQNVVVNVTFTGCNNITYTNVN